MVQEEVTASVTRSQPSSGTFSLRVGRRCPVVRSPGTPSSGISYVGSVDLLSMLPTPTTTGTLVPNPPYADAGTGSGLAGVRRES